MKITIRKASSTVKAGDAAYFLAFILLFMCDFYNTTTFKGLVDITFLLNAARVLSVILITVKCVYIDSYSIKYLKKLYKNFKNNKGNIYDWFACNYSTGSNVIYDIWIKYNIRDHLKAFF